MIVPQQYERLVIKDGEVTTELIEISGNESIQTSIEL